MIKYFKAIIGLLILLFNVRFFSCIKIFKGKRVVIVGPANSAFEFENGSYIDGFDYVIRINKALYTWNRENEKYIGTRTNILFHNFFENVDTGGGGPLDIDLFNKFGVKYLVQPRNDKEGWRVIFNFYKKYLKSQIVWVLQNDFYNQIQICFGKYKPTMGYCALQSVLASSSQEVFITGFTFFKTPYAVGYRDNLVDIKANEDHIKNQGMHSPDLEYNLFCKLLLESKVKKIYLDSTLFQILTADNIKLPENIYLKK